MQAEAALDDMQAFVEAGITTFDCADIYTGVESLIGDFVAPARTAHTTCRSTRSTCPTWPPSARSPRTTSPAAMDRSLQRLGVDALDLVQFHWWDYDRPGVLEAAGWLTDLRRAGKVRHIGVTNFNAPVLRVAGRGRSAGR